MPESKKHKGEGHRERLRQRFLESGLKGFQDYEVIELLLTLGQPRKDCKDMAKAALKAFGSFQGVIEADASALQEIKGIGPKNLIAIKLIKAAADRYLEKRLVEKDQIHNSRELFDYLYHILRDKKRECFNAIFLDARNRVLATKILFQGTLTASAVYPREVIAEAIGHNAAALIFAHNHPSGDPTPSNEDFSITKQLVFAARVMGISVHEHLVIGDNRYFSFADQGYIAEMNREYEMQSSRQ